MNDCIDAFERSTSIRGLADSDLMKEFGRFLAKTYNKALIRARQFIDGEDLIKAKQFLRECGSQPMSGRKGPDDKSHWRPLEVHKRDNWLKSCKFS